MCEKVSWRQKAMWLPHAAVQRDRTFPYAEIELSAGLLKVINTWTLSGNMSLNYCWKGHASSSSSSHSTWSPIPFFSCNRWCLTFTDILHSPRHLKISLGFARDKLTPSSSPTAENLLRTQSSWVYEYSATCYSTFLGPDVSVFQPLLQFPLYQVNKAIISKSTTSTYSY